jgi:NagD protein
VQGTLIDDRERKPIRGAVEFVEALAQKGVPYVLITNNTKQPSREFLSYLQSLGFIVDEDRYIDPLMVLDEVIETKRVAAYGVEGFLKSLRTLGFELDYERPNAVVISVKEDYDFATFAQIDEFLLGGASLYGMHQTSIYAKGDRRYPGVGALLAMFEFATGVKSRVVGKPSPLFYKKALKKIGGGDFSDVVIISDDPKGDLLGAKELGMRTIFVLSGKFKRAEEILPKLGFKPDAVYESVAEAAKELL